MRAMAKKATDTLSAGSRVRVKTGTNAPEFTEVCIEGWTGIITEIAGRKAGIRYMIEWDDATLDAMPPSYVELCEQKQLYYRMACLTGDDIEAMDN